VIDDDDYDADDDSDADDDGLWRAVLAEWSVVSQWRQDDVAALMILVYVLQSPTSMSQFARNNLAPQPVSNNFTSVVI